jgi:hypothetical protein
MRVETYFNWHARRAGGLRLGANYAFPSSILLDDGNRATLIIFSVSLFVCTVSFWFLYDIKESVWKMHAKQD